MTNITCESNIFIGVICIKPANTYITIKSKVALHATIFNCFYCILFIYLT